MPHIRHPKRVAFITLLVTCSAGWLFAPHQPAGQNSWLTKDAAVNPPDASSPPTARGDSVETLSAARRELDESRRALVSESYGRLPLTFEANAGRFDDGVKYVSRGRGYGLFLTPTEAVLTLRPAGSPTPSKADDAATPKAEAAVLRIRPVGASAKVRLEGFDEQPGKSNYFIGNDPSKWRTNVAHYAGVRYRQIYPGVDLVYHGRQRQLEYDFEVAPGADPGRIRVAFEGASALSLGPDGDLVLRLPGGGEVRQQRPFAYQEADGRREEVAARYVLKGEREVGFEVAGYDASRPLVIDPVLSYASYLGGSRTDEGRGIAVDSFGNAYVVGLTESADFPTVNSRPPGNDSNDVFVTKINPSGSAMVYSTYLGGSSTERGFGVAVDTSGNAHVTGSTHSNDFPRQNPIGGSGGDLRFAADAFVTKLSPEGSTLVYSTFFGGSGRDEGRGITLDSSGAAYVVGDTDSADFPTANAAQPKFGGFHFQGDAFVTKLNPAGSAFVYSTFIGGGDYEDGRSIAVDTAGSAYVTGATHSPDFPTANAFQPNLSSFCSGGSGRIAECLEAFVTKLSPAGSAFVYSTYLGGNLRDEGHGIAVDSAGNAYVAGETSSTNFPVTAGAFQPAISETHSGPFIPNMDAFVAKLNAAGSGLVYSTYLGGSHASEHVGGVAVGADGSAYVTGETGSATFPVVDTFQPRPADGGAIFVSKLNPSGAGLVFSTYLGGNNHETANGIALDSAGNAYVTGWTLGGFPVEKPFQPTMTGTQPDAIVAKIGNAPIQPPIVLGINAVTPGRGGNSGSVTVALHGSGFKSGATVKLTRAGQPDITAVAVGVSEDSFIARARFDLTGHAPGLRDVVLTNPDGRSVTRASAFNVVTGGRPEFWVDIVGSDSFRPGRPQTYFITFGNRGSIDAALVPIFIAMPKEAEYELGFKLREPPQPVEGQHFDFSQIPAHYRTDAEKILPLIVGFIPAGSSGSLKIRVTGGDQPLRLVARVRRPLASLVITSAAQPGVKGQLTRYAREFGVTRQQVGGLDCFGTILFEGASCGLNLVPGSGCVSAAVDYVGDTVLEVEKIGLSSYVSPGSVTVQDQVVSAGQTAAGGLATIAHCSTGAIPGVSTVLGAIDCALAADEISESCFGFDLFGESVKFLNAITARDPNYKLGATGAGAGHYISGEEPLRYAIFFENKSDATAPAQDVVVTDQLDASKLDFDTFSLGPISFGRDRQVVPPPGLSEFKQDIDLRPSNNLIVRVEATLEKATGLLTWRFTSLDPATGQPTEDPTAGFLPPNKNAPEGEGQVLFTVQPRKSVETGTEIRNKARIVFDTNAPIDTPEWLNTIDHSKPESHVLALAARQNSARFEVKWSGTDTGSGVQSYTVFVSEDGGPFIEWLRDTAAGSALFEGAPGKTYAFYSVARDATGNREEAPASADAATATEPLVLRFAAQSFSAGEGDGRAVINVLRTGNTDAATVNYATGDGTASERSDYTAALGQLHFAAGETSKSFTVLITDDALAEGSETVALTLADPADAATLTITDNDASSLNVNPLGDARFFVRQHYLDFLNRAPDEAGLDFWAGQLSACDAQSSEAARGACLEDRRINVSAAFFLSIEFQQTAYFAFRFYRASFPESPSRPRGLPRLRELLRDSQEVGRGVVVNQGDWRTTLENNRREFARRWVQRAEFVARFPASLSAQQFVDGLFANSGVTPTQAEREEALAAYGGGGTEGRAQALRSVADSGSVYNKQYNPAFVLTQYFGYLRRNPDDPPDADFAGFDFWLSKLDQFSRPGEDVRDERMAFNRARRAEMIRAFLVSVEYMTRFGPANFDIRR